MQSIFKGMAAAAVLLSAGHALGQVHAVDVILQVHSGRIVTARVDNGVTVSPRYVFMGTLGDIGVPNATFDPGFDSEDGTFSASMQVGITIRRALRVWNGQGFVPVPVSQMELTKNTTTIVTPPTDPPGCGVGDDLLLGLANSVGRLHQHPAYDLTGQGDAGIYMLQLQVWMGNDSTGVSDPIALLFNQNDTQADADAAFQWAESHFHTSCYANCDGSTTAPVLNINDFVCFQAEFASGDCSANCDGSTTAPVLNVNDFICFQSSFAAGCP